MIRGIRSLQHFAIRCRDVEAMSCFYREKLGFAELFRLKRDDGRLRLIYHAVNRTQFLELFPDAADDAPRDHFTRGLNHIALEVDDIDRVRQDADRLGLEIVQDITDGADGNRQLWIADPEGNRIEFMEMKPDCLQYASQPTAISPE